MFGVWRRTREACSFLLLSLSHEQEEVAVGLGAEGFRAVAIVIEKAGGKGTARVLTIFVLELKSVVGKQSLTTDKHR